MRNAQCVMKITNRLLRVVFLLCYVNIFFAVVVKFDIFSHGVEIMEACQYETYSPVEKTAAQKIHSETCPERVQNHI